MKLITAPPLALDYDGIPLAYRHVAGKDPTFVFLPGYMSDMEGTKALAVEDWAREWGRGCLRLDYSGCGSSGGRFDHGTISRWCDDALAVIDAATSGPLIVIGSSMGGWIALLVALARPERVTALVGIAAAPDFTEWGLSPDERAAAARDGRIERPSDYGHDPYIYTHALIADGQARQLLGGAIVIDAPVRLLHGQADADVPWRLSLDLAAQIRSADVQVTLVKDGDHRLSRPQDLALLRATLAQLSEA